MRTWVLVFLSACAAAVPEPAPPPPRPPAPLPPPEIPPVSIERCSDTDDGFDEWLLAFREHAVANGTPRELATRAFANITYDPAVIELDRTQRPHKASFESFSASHLTAARVKRGKRLLVEHAALLGRIEGRFGVPPEILVALWGLETDYGAFQGRTRSLSALATLAYDCRRAERFRGELESALRILVRGDLAPEQMLGAWAGELGQTQFLPSSYERFGVDFDEDGRVDLLGSVSDALGSTASYLAGHGWRRGEGYGPGTANEAALESWNKSEVYRRTVVLFASRLASPAGPVSPARRR